MQWISPKKLGMGVLIFLFATMLVGCEPPGPAEKAGKDLDKGVTNLKDSVDPRGPAQKVGDKIDQATGNK